MNNPDHNFYINSVLRGSLNYEDLQEQLNNPRRTETNISQIELAVRILAQQFDYPKLERDE